MNPIVRQELDALEKRIKLLHRTIDNLAERNTALHVAMRNMLDGKLNAEKEAQEALMDMSWRAESMEVKEMEYIPKDQLEVGAWYECDARNFEVGLWNGKVFEYIRYKFGECFPDTEQHWDDGPPHGTVKPMKKREGER